MEGCSGYWMINEDFHVRVRNIDEECEFSKSMSQIVMAHVCGACIHFYTEYILCRQEGRSRGPCILVGWPIKHLPHFTICVCRSNSHHACTLRAYPLLHSSVQYSRGATTGPNNDFPPPSNSTRQNHASLRVSCLTLQPSDS